MSRGPFTEPAKCPCCEKCWRDPRTGRCMCGGPFAGYVNVEKKQ
jgi:hypothetical protein